MTYLNTKFFSEIKKLTFFIEKKRFLFQNLVTVSVFSLFLGFGFGNLFGTFLNSFRHFINWDGFIITITIVLVEFLNYLHYKKKRTYKLLLFTSTFSAQNLFLSFVPKGFQRFLVFFSKKKTESSLLKTNNSITNNFFNNTINGSVDLASTGRFIKIINFYKIGLLLGFFIDAFKVGS
uniref:hypothetical chloroplast RF20 n=1 Tax=Gayralia brasiliensis TaxID=1286870 RepID=UPI0024116A12|nr:hypothetical chloroplast RF20 [Gayralia brasiliensis]YP_010733756.1 hypothetical chloroplast RF20 [Monostroma nitidum]WEG92953.1 hypothetical chloroplast RF20 [Gayralia brasiliensis]WEG93027.1 hypothetical chloroplast RF20 [Monostroma nitidum]